MNKAGVKLLLILSIAGTSFAQSSLEDLNEKIRPDDYLVKPEGEGPFPVTIILHTAAGPEKMDQAWAHMLAENGIAGLVVKSYSRINGYSEQSRAFRYLMSITSERVQHILATIEYLKTQPWADPTRIVLLGRSHGGWSALWFLATEMTPAEDKGVKAIVAYYPDCETQQPYTEGWSATVPVLIQMGSQDPVVSNTPCIKMAKAQQEQGRPVILEVYKGKGHDVDMGNDKIAQQARSDTLRFIISTVRR